MDKYILWNAKLQGWMSHGSYNSDRAYAKEYDRATAFSLAKSHFQSGGSMNLIPISVADYDEVKA